MSTPHIEAKEGIIAKTVLMPGDPLRAKYIADTYLENVVKFNNVRNMFGFTGTYKGKKIDAVVCVEARGFIFGAVLAYKLNAGLVLVRKKGKLPADCFEESYSLEYGVGILEIHRDGLSEGERVVIVDDLIATGGTAKATANLVKKLGAEIIECAFLIELPDLKGREQLKGCEIYSMMKFEGE